MTEREGRGRRRALLAASAAAAALILIFIFVGRPSPRAEVRSAAAARQDLVVPILCDGTIEPPPGGELRAPEAAMVESLPVRDGEHMEKGQTILVLGNREIAERALEARSRAGALRAETEKARADANQAAAERARAQTIVAQDRGLLASGAISKSQSEADKLDLEQAENRLRSARAELESLDSGSSSRRALAEKSARELSQRVEALTIRAPAAGIVYGLPARTGERVDAGQIVANVAERRDLRVRARVDQPDLPRVRPGERMIVQFDGLPGRRFEGTVEQVSPGLREIGGRDVGEALGLIHDARGELPPNASVSVQIIVNQKENALVVPRAALYRDGDRRWVYVLDHGKARRRAVEIGLLGTNEAEIVQGVSAGEQVLLPGTEPFVDGMRVRAHPAAP
jgi:RND family efflux transporter MFP subunit